MSMMAYQVIDQQIKLESWFRLATKKTAPKGHFLSPDPLAKSAYNFWQKFR